MSTFIVTVTRTETRRADIEVEADSRKEAEQSALAEAGDHEFPSAADAEYGVEGIRRK